MSETSLFDSLDKDGDGSISREESKALLNKFLEHSPIDASEEEKEKLLDECFSKADIDSDGTLSKVKLSLNTATYMDTPPHPPLHTFVRMHTYTTACTHTQPAAQDRQRHIINTCRHHHWQLLR